MFSLRARNGASKSPNAFTLLLFCNITHSCSLRRFYMHVINLIFRCLSIEILDNNEENILMLFNK